ncbi:MAG: GAF domain-containing sensor histidine kinase [Chloroflexota bacterium]
MREKITEILNQQFKRLQWLIFAILAAGLLVLSGILYLTNNVLLVIPLSNWLPSFVVTLLLFLAITAVVYTVIGSVKEQLDAQVNQSVSEETLELQATNERLKSIQELAATMRATLSFDRVVEQALNVCNQSVIDSGIPRQELVSTVFLYRAGGLYPMETRTVIGRDLEKRLPGQEGFIAKALNQADITVSNNPASDPELRKTVAFRSCQTAVCIPLRTGFNIFGAMVIGSKTTIKFTRGHYELFTAVADQAVIALQNATLYQDLEAEKQRLIDATENARKELARDLHDGPTQSIAAIAMRVNFIRSLVGRNPEQAMAELQKVEELAKETSKEIRGMLFTLRPLVLETQGLQAAIETVVARLIESDGLNIKFTGGEYGELLDDAAQSVTFSIVEEALGNARKYAKAKLIEIRFWQEDNLFVVLVQDQGVGFDTQDVNRDYSSRGSLGMVNMRERAERIDGSLRVESKPNEGTKITLVVPLDKHGRRVNSRK